MVPTKSGQRNSFHSRRNISFLHTVIWIYWEYVIFFTFSCSSLGHQITADKDGSHHFWWCHMQTIEAAVPQESLCFQWYFGWWFWTHLLTSAIQPVLFCPLLDPQLYLQQYLNRLARTWYYLNVKYVKYVTKSNYHFNLWPQCNYYITQRCGI